MDKVCTKCGETKTLDLFGRDRTSRDGLKAGCKACAAAGDKERYNKSFRISPKVTPETFFNYVEKNEDGHWKYVGPKGRTGWRIIESWCDDEDLGFKCCNPDHLVSTGELATLSDTELMDGETSAMVGFNLVGADDEEESINARMRFLDAPVDLRGPENWEATKFLSDNGYNQFGEPLQRRSHRKGKARGQ